MTKHMHETLHCHTVYSDGLLTHEEVLDVMADHDIGVVAFTDHEAILDEDKFNSLRAMNHDVKFISGIELTFNAIENTPGTMIGASESGHMIGLWIDPTYEPLIEYCEHAQERRIRKIQHNVDGLKRLGFDISFEDVTAVVKGKSYAKPHVVQAILARPDNVARLHTILEQMHEESQHHAHLAARYDRIREHDDTRLMYDLFLGAHPYRGVAGPHEDLEQVEMDQVVKLIRGAGGVASLAHWFTVDGAIDTDTLTSMIRDHRIDGFETRYGFYDPPEMQNGILEQVAHLTKLAGELNCVTTGGVDFHKVPDLRRINEPEYTDRFASTIGMTEAILTRMSPMGKKWSTL